MARLKAAPLIRYHSPTYPTRIEVMADRQLLARHVPPTWLSHRELAGAFGALLLATPTGCTDRSGATPGRGMLGCVVVAAPVFLSEEEALQVIKEELNAAGLNMSARDVPINSILIQGQRLQPGYEWTSGYNGELLVDSTGPLVVDMEDPARKVAVEYVSEKDFYPLGGGRERQGTMSSKTLAASLAERVNEEVKDHHFRTFYDPATCIELYPLLKASATNSSATTQPTTEAQALTESKRLLRMQVRDFVDWLKAQGVI